MMINSDQIAVYGFSNLTDRMIKNGEVSTFSDKYEKLAGAELGQVQVNYPLALFAWLTVAVTVIPLC